MSSYSPSASPRPSALKSSLKTSTPTSSTGGGFGLGLDDEASPSSPRGGASPILRSSLKSSSEGLGLTSNSTRDTGLGVSPGSPGLRTGLTSHSNDIPETPRIGGGRSMGGATDAPISSPFLRQAATSASRDTGGFGLDSEGPSKSGTIGTGARPGSPGTNRPGSAHGSQPPTPTLSGTRDGRGTGNTSFGLGADDYDDRDSSRAIGSSNRGAASSGPSTAAGSGPVGEGRDRPRMGANGPDTYGNNRVGNSGGGGFGLDAEGPRGAGTSTNSTLGTAGGLRGGGPPQRQPDFPTVDSIGSVAAARRASGLEPPPSAFAAANRSSVNSAGTGISSRGPGSGATLGQTNNRSTQGFGLDAEDQLSPSSPRGGAGAGRTTGGPGNSPARGSGFGLDAEQRPGSPVGGRPGLTAAAKQQGGFGLEAEAGGGDDDRRGLDGRSRSNGREGDRSRMPPHPGTGGGHRDDGYGLMAEDSPRERQGQQRRGPGAPTSAAGARGGLFADDYDDYDSSGPYGLNAGPGDGRPLAGRSPVRRRLGMEGDDDLGRQGGGGVNSSSPSGFRRPGVREGGPDLPANSGGGPLNLQEVSVAGRPYLLDRSSGRVYKDVTGDTVPEPVGRWVEGRVVFTPPTTELEFYSALATYLQRKDLALEDVFAVLDSDLDGCLRAGPGSGGARELGRLILDVMPGLPPSEAQLFSALADFDGDGYVSVEDLQAAGIECFEVAAEVEMGPASRLTGALHAVALTLMNSRDRSQLLFRSLDASKAGWLEPAQWVRYLRALGPELSSKEIRYILAHIFDGPSDNRKSLHEVTHALSTADTAYLDAARRGHGPSAAAKRPPANAAAHGGAVSGLNSSGKLGRQGGTEKQKGSTPGGTTGSISSTDHASTASGTPEATERAARMRARAESTLAILMRRGAAIGAATAAAAAASGAAIGSTDPSKGSTLANEASLKRAPGAAGAGAGSPTKVLGGAFYSAAAAAATGGTSNPRSAVSDWFYALAAIMFKAQQGGPTQGLGLRELLRKYDSDGDGYLDAVDARSFIKAIMPGVTEAQAVYIKGALNPTGSLLLSFEDIVRAVNRFSSGLLWEGPTGVRAPLDALLILSQFMAANKVKLQTLVSMFDGDGDGLLGEVDTLRLLRFARPSLTDKQLDKCLIQMKTQVDKDRDGLISLHDLRRALQVKQEAVAAAKAQQQLQHQQVAAAADHMGTLTSTMLSSDPHYLPGVPEVDDDLALLTSDPWDPFTLASLAASTPGRSSLLASPGSASGAAPYSLTTLIPQAGSTGMGGGAGPLAVLLNETLKGQAVQLRNVVLDPLVYCGYTYVHDPVSNLVYLPVRISKGPEDGSPAAITGGTLQSLLQQCELHVFGRLRPDKHVQRVETAAANALFAALDEQLKGHHQTLESLVARFDPHRLGALDMVGVSQLVEALIPRSSGGCGVAHYFMALFDLDGDGQVTCDDIMDAFEEMGTTVDTLQTPAHVVHARAYKLLSQLAAFVASPTVGPAGGEEEAYALFLEYDSLKRGGLTLPELSRFIAQLAQWAAHQQSLGQRAIPGQSPVPGLIVPGVPGSVPHPPVPAALGGLQDNSPAAAAVLASTLVPGAGDVSPPMPPGPSSDQVGAVCVYLAARVMGARTTITWDMLSAVLQELDAKLPTELRDPPPAHTRPGTTPTPYYSTSSTLAPGGGINSYVLSPRTPARWEQPLQQQQGLPYAVTGGVPDSMQATVPAAPATPLNGEGARLYSTAGTAGYAVHQAQVLPAGAAALPLTPVKPGTYLSSAQGAGVQPGSPHSTLTLTPGRPASAINASSSSPGFTGFAPHSGGVPQPGTPALHAPPGLYTSASRLAAAQVQAAHVPPESRPHHAAVQGSAGQGGSTRAGDITLAPGAWGGLYPHGTAGTATGGGTARYGSTELQPGALANILVQRAAADMAYQELADSTVAIRPPPLRQGAAASQPSVHPERREVELVQYTTYVGGVRETLLLDQATGLVYRPPPQLQLTRGSLSDSDNPPHQLWLPSQAQYSYPMSPDERQLYIAAVQGQPLQGSTNGNLGNATQYPQQGHRQQQQSLQQQQQAGGSYLTSGQYAPDNVTPPRPARPYVRPGSAGGALAVHVSPDGSTVLPYPELVGRLQYPDNRLLPAPVPSLHALFGSLYGAATDIYQLTTLFKMHDRDGRGLDLPGLQQLLQRVPAAGGGAGTPHGPAQHSGPHSQGLLGAAEVDLLLAALDRDGDGRVSLEEMVQGVAPSGMRDKATGQPVLAAEARAIQVLHQASTVLGSPGGLRSFWLVHQRGNNRAASSSGRMDLDTASALLAQLLPGLHPPDLELVYAFLGAAAMGRDADVSPDGLLQLFRALPLRYTPVPQTAGTATATQGSTAPGFSVHDSVSTLPRRPGGYGAAANATGGISAYSPTGSRSEGGRGGGAAHTQITSSGTFGRRQSTAPLGLDPSADLGTSLIAGEGESYLFAPGFMPPGQTAPQGSTTGAPWQYQGVGIPTPAQSAAMTAAEQQALELRLMSALASKVQQWIPQDPLLAQYGVMSPAAQQALQMYSQGGAVPPGGVVPPGAAGTAYFMSNAPGNQAVHMGPLQQQQQGGSNYYPARQGVVGGALPAQQQQQQLPPQQQQQLVAMAPYLPGAMPPASLAPYLPQPHQQQQQVQPGQYGPQAAVRQGAAQQQMTWDTKRYPLIYAGVVPNHRQVLVTPTQQASSNPQQRAQQYQGVYPHLPGLRPQPPPPPRHADHHHQHKHGHHGYAPHLQMPPNTLVTQSSGGYGRLPSPTIPHPQQLHTQGSPHGQQPPYRPGSPGGISPYQYQQHQQQQQQQQQQGSGYADQQYGLGQGHAQVSYGTAYPSPPAGQYSQHQTVHTGVTYSRDPSPVRGQYPDDYSLRHGGLGGGGGGGGGGGAYGGGLTSASRSNSQGGALVSHHDQRQQQQQGHGLHDDERYDDRGYGLSGSGGGGGGRASLNATSRHQPTIGHQSLSPAASRALDGSGFRLDAPGSPRTGGAGSALRDSNTSHHPYSGGTLSRAGSRGEGLSSAAGHSKGGLRSGAGAGGFDDYDDDFEDDTRPGSPTLRPKRDPAPHSSLHPPSSSSTSRPASALRSTSGGGGIGAERGGGFGLDSEGSTPSPRTGGTAPVPLSTRSGTTQPLTSARSIGTPGVSNTEDGFGLDAASPRPGESPARSGFGLEEDDAPALDSPRSSAGALRTSGGTAGVPPRPASALKSSLKSSTPGTSSTGGFGLGAEDLEGSSPPASPRPASALKSSLTMSVDAPGSKAQSGFGLDADSDGLGLGPASPRPSSPSPFGVGGTSTASGGGSSTSRTAGGGTSGGLGLYDEPSPFAPKSSGGAGGVSAGSPAARSALKKPALKATVEEDDDDRF